MVSRVLFFCPVLDDVESFRQLTECIKLGESRWDSLKSTPYSVPGRYINILDLRNVFKRHEEIERAQARLVFYSCLCVIFSALPNLKELYLPEGFGTLPRSVLEALQDSPCVRSLRVVHGLEVTHRINAQGLDPLVQLLAKMRELKDLKIYGLGAQDEGIDPAMINPLVSTDLRLDKLETLRISSLKNGLLMHALIKAKIPALREFHLNTYYGLANDLTHPLMKAHGHQLIALSIYPSIDWPPVRVTPCSGILSLCPNLKTLKYLDRSCLPPPETFAADEEDHVPVHAHPLKHLTLTKWSTNANSRDVPLGGHVERLLRNIHSCVASHRDHGQLLGSHSFSPPTLSALSISPRPTTHLPSFSSLPDLESITFEEFTWLRPDLGPAALNAGVNGVLRKFASKMANAGPGLGVRVLDMHGHEVPPVSHVSGMGRRNSGTGTRGSFSYQGTGTGIRKESGGEVTSRRVPIVVPRGDDVYDYDDGAD